MGKVRIAIFTAAYLLSGCVQGTSLHHNDVPPIDVEDSSLVFRFLSFDPGSNRVDAEVSLSNEGSLPVCIARYSKSEPGFAPDIFFRFRRISDGTLITFPQLERITLTSGTPNRNDQGYLVLKPGDVLHFKYASEWNDVVPIATPDVPMLGFPDKTTREFKTSDRVALAVEARPTDCIDLSVEKQTVFYVDERAFSQGFLLL